MRLTLLSHHFKYQFATISELLSTIHYWKWYKTVGNQVPHRGLDVYVMKIESMAVEMF
ncbi:MAG: hypothetical protein GX762_01160 [Bacteroidales bacterium]|nr:hypothetical protein [Bacteroidales bacterium]